MRSAMQQKSSRVKNVAEPKLATASRGCLARQNGSLALFAGFVSGWFHEM